MAYLLIPSYYAKSSQCYYSVANNLLSTYNKKFIYDGRSNTIIYYSNYQSTLRNRKVQ